MHHTSKPTLPATRLALAAALLAACAPLPEDADTSAAPVVLRDAAPPDTVHELGGRFLLPHPRRGPAWPGDLWRPEWYGNLRDGAGDGGVGEPDLTHWPPYERGW